MPLVQWDDDLSVDHDEIDRQHRKWIKHINEMHEALASGDPDRLGAIKDASLQQMIDYAKSHFEFEEKYMDEIGYPQLAAHKQVHDGFRKMISKIQADARRGFQPLNTQLMSIMMNWLTDHILSEDKKYSLYVSNSPQ
jgi:hemerythrin